MADGNRCGGTHRLGRQRHFRAGQVHCASAGWARVLRVQGLRKLAGYLCQSRRRLSRGDPRESRDDRAYQAGAPGNGKPFPDGAKMAKIHWNAQKSAEAPDPTTRVPGTLHDIDFMVKDSKRFADSGGWGWGAFNYDAASDTFTPATLADNPPQANDAKCGFACHTIVKAKDYVFTAYPKR
jgi:hypothetical protein